MSMDDFDVPMRKTRCFWCQTPSRPSAAPCCVGAMMWRAAVAEDARRWLAENNPDLLGSEFGDDGLE
jgi:hypothetical protein